MKSQPLHKDELVKDIFLRLLERWDIKDKAGARGLALASAQIADGFTEAMREVMDGKPVSPKAPPKEAAH